MGGLCESFWACVERDKFLWGDDFCSTPWRTFVKTLWGSRFRIRLSGVIGEVRKGGRECIISTRVLITKPAAVRGERLEWVEMYCRGVKNLPSVSYLIFHRAATSAALALWWTVLLCVQDSKSDAQAATLQYLPVILQCTCVCVFIFQRDHDVMCFSLSKWSTCTEHSCWNQVF